MTRAELKKLLHEAVRQDGLTLVTSVLAEICSDAAKEAEASHDEESRGNWQVAEDQLDDVVDPVNY